MNLQDLHHRLGEQLRMHPRAAEHPVMIVRGDPSVGAIAMTEVKSAHAGFDWENNKFLLHPVEPLHKRNDATEIKKLRKQLDRMAWSALQMRREVAHLGGAVSSPLDAPSPTDATLQAMVEAYTDATTGRRDHVDADPDIMRAVFAAIFKEEL